MKITFVLHSVSLAGGVRVVATYAQRLKQRGHEVVVVSGPPPQPSLVKLAKSSLRERRLNLLPKKSPSHFDGLDVEHHIVNHPQPITNEDVPDADVVIATWWETAEWVAGFSPAKGAKAYFVQHYEVFDYLPINRVKATWSLPLYKIVVAEWLATIAREEYGDTHLSIVPNSVDRELFRAPPRGKQIVPTVGMVYEEAAWKGCDIGFDAVALAQQDIPNLRLLTFGRAELPAGTLPTNSEHLVNPPQQLIRAIYSKCDAWLFCSRFEGFGLPILEAMACRTPVIGTPAGVAPEFLSDGAGLLVDMDNPTAMAQAIKQLYQMPEAEWQQLSERAYNKIVGYSWDDATDRFEAALETAIQHQKSLNSYTVVT
jgi:glycosyltransferase involved in cell wall biosynthesis